MPPNALKHLIMLVVVDKPIPVRIPSKKLISPVTEVKSEDML